MAAMDDRGRGCRRVLLPPHQDIGRRRMQQCLYFLPLSQNGQTEFRLLRGRGGLLSFSCIDGIGPSGYSFTV